MCEVWSSLLVGILLYFAMFATRLWRGNNLTSGQEGQPQKWRKVGRLSALYLYPVKSGRPTYLKEARATSLGLMEVPSPDGKLSIRDRVFVVFRAGTKLSLKMFPGLIHLTVQASGKNTIEMMYPGHESLHFKLPSPNEEHFLTTLRLWDETVPTVDCGDEVSEWLSNIFHKENGERECGLRLGYWSDSFTKRRDVSVTKYSKLYNKLRNEDTGAYSDLSSYLMLNEASIEDLKLKLNPESECKISALNFRPNLVIQGSSVPYEEDDWDWIKVGDSAIFRNFKPCTRCSITTINPETGIRNPQQEPLKTLKQYRQLKDPVLRKAENNSPVMGIYIGIYQEGAIKVGDPIYIG